MNPIVLVAYFFHLMAVAMIWLPMYKRLTSQVGADSSLLAMSFGFGAFAAFLVLRQLQRMPYLTFSAIAAEVLLALSVLVAKREIMVDISDWQSLVLAFFAIGFTQSFVFSILQSMIFRNATRQQAFRLRSIGTLGFGFGVAMYLTKLTHDNALEIAIYILAIVAALLLAALKGNELPSVSPAAGTTTFLPIVMLVLLLAFMGSFLEGINGQTAQKWLSESIDENNAVLLILAGLFLEAMLLLYFAPFVSDATLVLLGFIGWFLVFQGFAMSVYSLSVCSCFNCALGFTLASQLARFHRPSYQALLCVMNAVGNQFASISILTCRQFVGEDYIAFVAFAVAIVAVAIAACTLFRMSQLGLPIDKLDSRTSSTSEAV